MESIMSDKKKPKVMLSQLEDALEERQNDRRQKEKPVDADRRKTDRRTKKKQVH
jgi:hypothetical protein